MLDSVDKPVATQGSPSIQSNNSEVSLGICNASGLREGQGDQGESQGRERPALLHGRLHDEEKRLDKKAEALGIDEPGLRSQNAVR